MIAKTKSSVSSPSIAQKQLRDPGFTLFEERASFISPHQIQVGDKTLTGKSIIIATGSVVSKFDIPGLEEAGYVTSDDVLEMREQPESMIVLGAGAVAVELAQFFFAHRHKGHSHPTKWTYPLNRR